MIAAPTILRAKDLKATPWLNGAGSTTEYWRLDDPGTPSGFIIRVSVARIEGHQAFSHFPGITRHIVQIDGDPVALTIDGNRQEMAPLTPLTFAGEADVVGEVAGWARDLNLMCRRGQCSGKIRALTLRARETPEFVPSALFSGIYVVDPLRLSDGTALESGDMTVGSWPSRMAAEQNARVLHIMVMWDDPDTSVQRL